jgi:broad specificity phosphatase PhoE
VPWCLCGEIFWKGLTLRQLLLIKHSLPEFLENVPAREWHLSAEGRHRCQDLARIVAPYAPQTVVSSLELKAQETGQLLAGFLQLPFSTAENLHEHERRNTPFSGQEEFEANILRLFQNPGQRVMGEETADEAHARFAEAVRGVLEAHPTGHLAIVAHGTVISL